MPENQDIYLLRGCDYTLRLRLTRPPSADLGNVDEWTTQLELRTVKGSASPTVTFAGALSNVARAAELGIFDISLSAAQTTALTERTYFFAIRRTDAGFSTVFTKGIVHVDSY